MKKVLKSIQQFFKKGTNQVKKVSGKFIDKRPFASFFVVLGVLIVLIILSNFLGAPKQTEKVETTPVKEVQIYKAGASPRLTLQAQIRKSGSLRITALTGGVVSQIYKQEGDTFARGQSLMYISTNYFGGSAQSLQTKLARLQYQHTLDTESAQRDLIQKQRDVANELNKFNHETDLSKLQKDTTNMQLDLQNKAIDVARESQLTQLQLAQVAEAMSYPAAPFGGVVEHVSVKVGQAVNPGQELMVISQQIPEDPITAVVYVSADIASQISSIEPSNLYIKNKLLQESPFYVTQDAIQGTLYGVYFNIPDSYIRLVTEGAYITIDIPLQSKDTASYYPFIPVDAVYQTADQDYVFVAGSGRALVKNVELGDVFGSYVEIKKGLSAQDAVILNRNIVAGDPITIK